MSKQPAGANAPKQTQKAPEAPVVVTETQQPAEQAPEATQETTPAATETPEAPQPSETPAPAPAAEAPKETPAEQPKPAGKQAPADAYEFLSRKYGGVTAAVKSVLDHAYVYVHRMGPKAPMDESQGSLIQRALYNNILTAIGLPNGEYKAALDGLLFIMQRERHDAFSDRLLFRYINTAKFTREDRVLFESLLNMLRLAADPTKRRVISQVHDVKGTVARLPDQQAQLNLLDFFKS